MLAAIQLCLSLLYLSLPAASSTPHPLLQRRQFDDRFDWSVVTPRRELTYHDCYDGLKCARLVLPLDWTMQNDSSRNTTSQTVAVAIIMIPATVPVTDPSFGGTVLMNPGGPGGSGTQLALDLGAYAQGILDGEKHYEILGFDPRGIGLSMPRADCYKNAFNRAADFAQREGLPSVVSRPEGVSYNFQAAKGQGDLCEEAGPESIFNYMSTASVARDMLEIVERVAESRPNSAAVFDSGPSKLQYLGFSYGTFIGNTFASMFPERVGRMVLDGVLNAEDYIRGTWSRNLIDAEKAVDAFYQACFDGGAACALKRQMDTSAADVRQRVDDFILSLVDSPIAVALDGRVRLVKSLLVRDAIRRALYGPITSWESLSFSLAEALAGNYSFLLQTAPTATIFIDETCSETSESFPPPNYSWADDASSGVLCGDSAYDAGERNETWAQDVVDFLENQSFTTGESFARTPLSCSGWGYRPKYVFRGPFGSASQNGAQSGAEQPPVILLLSARYDHVTPLANAEDLLRQYPGSGLVIQESVGHCAFLAAKSLCTEKIVREYFVTGAVPAHITTCEPDCVPRIPYETCPNFL